RKRVIRSTVRRQLADCAAGVQSPSRSRSAAKPIARSPNSYQGRNEPVSCKVGRERSPRGARRMEPTRYVGIDVSAAILDVAVHDGATRQLDNDAAGCLAVTHHLRELGVTLVVLEATGVYHRDVTTALV